MVVQARLVITAMALAGSAVLATPVEPVARTDVFVGPYQVSLGGRTVQLAVADRCITGHCALIEIVVRPVAGPVWRIAL